MADNETSAEAGWRIGEAESELAGLRAENERLKELEDTASSCLVEANTIENQLRAENERLKERLQIVSQTAEANIEFAKDLREERASLRAEVAELKRQLAEAKHWLSSREGELKTAQDALIKAYDDLALAREENLSLRRQREART